MILALLPESLDQKRKTTDGLTHRGTKVNSDTNSVHGGFTSPEAQKQPVAPSTGVHNAVSSPSEVPFVLSAQNQPVV